MQRRNFLLNGAAAILAASGFVQTLLLTSGTAAAARSKRRRRRQMSDFEACIDTWFYVDDGGWKPVELVSVRKGSTSSREIEQFSCLFRGYSNSVVGSGVHTVQSDAMGEFQLYFEAAGDDGYENYSRADFALL